MRRFDSFVLSLLLVATQAQATSAGIPNKLGTVNFPVSCSSAAQARFNTAVTLLHSFWYDRSEEVFRDVAAIDPACAMAYWGIAMSRWHELWAPPDAKDAKVAATAIAQAEQNGAKTDKERRFISAIADFWRFYNPSTGYGGDDRYTSDMAALYRSYPADRQVALFYALALIATAPTGDKTFAQRRKAGAILEPIFAAEPNDPGAAHYIIHAYDDPKLAAKALYAAREYSKIAPAVPHALHMPSHTFTDLGLWEDSIASNRASLGADHADYPHTEDLGSPDFDDFHSTDFLEYAYLQAGRMQDATALANLAARSRTVPDGPGDQLEYLLTVNRRLIERGEWQTAAAFSVPQKVVAQLTYPLATAEIDYVRGLGAARSNQLAAARADLRKINDLEKVARSQHFVFLTTYTAVEGDSLQAWIAQASGQETMAVSMLRKATVAIGMTDNFPPPYLVWPVQEQLGQLLLEQHQPAQALVAFRRALEANPNRLRSLAGAAQAAGESGDRVAALGYDREIIVSCPYADADVPQVAQAQRSIGSQH